MQPSDISPDDALAAALERVERALARLEKAGGGLFPGLPTNSEDKRRLETLRRENAALRDMIGVANRKLGDVIGRLNNRLEG